MKRVYEPNKALKTLDEILTDLYLLKTAVGVEKDEKIIERITKLREKVNVVKENS